MKKNPNIVSKFYYSIFIWSPTCIGRHTAHHQEPKTALATSGFSYVECCWTCSWWMLSGTVPDNLHQLHVPRMKTRGCQCSFRLLIMGGVSPETCWASYKYGIIKFWYVVAFLGFFFMNCTRMHGSTNTKNRVHKDGHQSYAHTLTPDQVTWMRNWLFVILQPAVNFRDIINCHVTVSKIVLD
jgi:hypothetical protein